MNYKKIILALTVATSILAGHAQQKEPVDYVNPLMGTDSKISLSNGNTYPAIARPWGMNFWMPQTGKMGDGWLIPTPRTKSAASSRPINPVRGSMIRTILHHAHDRPAEDRQEQRASWFSHKAEKAMPHYYSVYLSEYNLTTEITLRSVAPTSASPFPRQTRHTWWWTPFDRGSYIKVIPEEQKIVATPHATAEACPQNFRNYFVIVFDKPFTFNKVWADYHTVEKHLELQSNHVGAAIGFSTKKGETGTCRVASSFISPEQAELNLKEIGVKSFDQTKEEGRRAWNDILGRIRVEDDNTDRCARSTLACIARCSSHACFTK